MHLGKDVDLHEAHVGGLCFIVVDADLGEVFIGVEVVLALPRELHELIRQDLSEQCSVLRPISGYFPFEEVLFGMELHTEDGVVFGLGD